MLILTRRIGEKIIIDGTITITVMDFRGDQIKFGIDAPRTVKVYREEIFQAIQDENLTALNASAKSLPVIDFASNKKS